MTIIPPYLQPGDTVGITCPAGYFCTDEVQPAVQALMNWGYRVKIGKTVGEQDNQFAGTDDERAADLQDMLDDDQVKAILFGRGGYGTVRIIDRINFNKFYLHPKWLCGYSDITVLHSHIQTQLHIPTLHGEMCIDLKYGNDDASAHFIQKAFSGESLSYEVEPHELNRPGAAQGILTGGNLSILASLTGSASDIDTYGKILFLEEVHEYLYNIDRMMFTLKRSGKLNHLAGLVVGGITRSKEDDQVPFGQTPYEIILDKVKEFNYPVCFGFPAGHEAENYVLKLGVVQQLTVGTDGCVLKEKGMGW